MSIFLKKKRNSIKQTKNYFTSFQPLKNVTPKKRRHLFDDDEDINII